ncbi:hypothetical protein ON010_g4644 [Phytophthora cinnamomi]|nr:hypothetical protein ON010_g4644 [Phytophthora cinnamomi]
MCSVFPAPEAVEIPEDLTADKTLEILREMVAGMEKAMSDMLAHARSEGITDVVKAMEEFQHLYVEHVEQMTQAQMKANGISQQAFTAALQKYHTESEQFRQQVEQIYAQQAKTQKSSPSSNLLAAKDADRGATAAGGLGVLAAHLEAPPVTQTTVSVDLLEALVVLAPLALQVVGHDLRVLARLEVLLSVQEPHGDLELQRVLDDGHDALDLVVGQLAGALGDVHLGLLADHDGEAAAHTLDGGQSDPHLAATINVGVENTENVLEVRPDDKRLDGYTHNDSQAWEEGRCGNAGGRVKRRGGLAVPKAVLLLLAALMTALLLLLLMRCTAPRIACEPPSLLGASV